METTVETKPPETESLSDLFERKSNLKMSFNLEYELRITYNSFPALNTVRSEVKKNKSIKKSWVKKVEVVEWNEDATTSVWRVKLSRRLQIKVGDIFQYFQLYASAGAAEAMKGLEKNVPSVSVPEAEITNIQMVPSSESTNKNKK